jgi:hypothetical protein
MLQLDSPKTGSLKGNQYRGNGALKEMSGEFILSHRQQGIKGATKKHEKIPMIKPSKRKNSTRYDL